MPQAQNPQALHSFNLALHPDHYKTVVPNLSYPSRPTAHIPWSGSTAPLRFSQTGRPEVAIAASTPNAQVPSTPNISPSTSSIQQAFRGIHLLIWVKLTGIFMRVKHHLSAIVRKLKSIKQKDIGAMSSEVPSNV